MVEKPAYCMYCRHAFEYDTDTAEAGRFRYILKCPNCGKYNRVLKDKYMIAIESAGVFIGTSLLWYFLFHHELYPSIFLGLVMGLASGLTSYYFRVHRPKRAQMIADHRP